MTPTNKHPQQLQTDNMFTYDVENPNHTKKYITLLNSADYL